MTSPGGLNKVELPQYRYGNIRVYTVSGEWIRNTYANESIGDRKGIDFTMGGHYYVYWKIIPKNEIWVEETLQPMDRKATILHEMTERRIMSMGKEYDETHGEYANPPEIVARQNPHVIDKMIDDEMARYEKPVRRKQEKTPKPRSVAEIEKEYEKYAVPKTQIDYDEDDEIAPKYYLGRRILAKVEAS